MLNLKDREIPDLYLNIGHFLNHFMMLIFAKAAYDAGKSFNLDYDEIIIYGTLGMIMFGAFSPISSILANKFGRISLMIVYHFGLGVSAILASISSSLFEITIYLGIMGAFASIYHPVGIAMLLKKEGKIGIRMGINGVWGNMGISFAPIITGILLFYGNWKLSFLFPGCFCILYGFIFLYASFVNQTSKKSEHTETKNKESFKKKWQMALFALGLSTATGGFIFGTMSFIIPRYFEIYSDNITTNIAMSGILAGIIFAVAAFAQVLVGYLIDKISPKLVLFWLSLGQILFIFLSSQFEDYLMFFSMLFAMSFVFGQIPITDTVLARYIPDEWRSSILSIKFLLNLTIAALVLPFTSLMLQNGLTLKTVLFITSLSAIGVFIASIILPKQEKIEIV